MEKMTMTRLAELVPDEAAAYLFLEKMRWHGEPKCPHCDSTDCGFISPKNGADRLTRTGAKSARRLWQCRSCRKQFSVITGTVMHGTKIPVRKWLFVMFEISANKNGIAAREVERRYGLCPKSAWFMLHRLREAMDNDGPASMFRGTVVADETFIGGSIANKHRKTIKPVPIGQPNPYAKTAVLSLIDTATGEARSKVVPDVTGPTLRKAIAEQVDMGNSTLHTDEAGQYVAIGREFLAHRTVNHKAGEYVRGMVTSNQAENFFSQLKRSLDGTHHHVSAKHLPRYLAEFDYRFSTRKMDDTERMQRLVAQIGGTRLTYRPLIAA